MLLEDWLVGGVLILLAGLHIAGLQRFTLSTWFVERGLGLFGVILGLSVLFAALRVLRSRERRLWPLLGAPLSLARHFGPFVVLLVAYENILGLVGRLRPVLYDETLMRLDLLLFPQHPTLWFESLVTPERTAWFSFFYLSLYIYPLLSGGLLYLSGRLTAFRHFMLTFTLVGLIGYLGYLCVPVIGPRYYFARYYHVALSSGQALPQSAELATWLAAPWVAIADRISYDQALLSGAPRNCFPSLHTAWGLVILIFAYRQLRPLFWLYLGPIALLILSTLYLRFHYVVDLLAGAALALLGSYAIPRCEQAFARWVAPQPADPPSMLPSLAEVASALPAPLRALVRAASAYLASRAQLWPQALLLLSVAPIYITCLPSGLTEAHRGEDGAELVAAAVTGGVAHPTGYPLYLLLLRGLCGLYRGADPIDVAHVSSAFFTLAAACLLLQLLRELLHHFVEAPSPWSVELPALSGAWVFCFLGTVWNQAVIAEVYALHALFVALVLWQLTRLLLSAERRAARSTWLALSFGLGLCHHLTLLHLLPAAALTLWLSGAWSRSLLWRAGLAGWVGLLPYLSLLAAARRQPVLSWGNPDTLSRLFAMISGQQYRFRLHGDAQAVLRRIVERCALAADAGHLTMIVGLFGAAIALYWALREPGDRSRPIRRWLAVAAVAVLGNLIGAGLYDIEDLRSYFIPTELCFAAAIGLGLAAVARAGLAQRGLAGVARYVVAGLAVCTVGTVLLRNVKQADLHGRHALDREVRRIVAEAPPGALIIGHGDGLMFGLWYERFVRSSRRDLDLLNRDLLAQDWYIRSRQHFTPQLRWPTGFDFDDGQLNPVEAVLAATVRANYSHRPIIALRDYTALTGCQRTASQRLVCPASKSAPGP